MIELKIDMDMPEYCMECIFVRPVMLHAYCGAATGINNAIPEEIQQAGRPDWCPLKEAKRENE